MFALGALTLMSSNDTKENNRKCGISASLLSSLIADFTIAAKIVESGADSTPENLNSEDAVLSNESIPFVINSSSIVPETFIILFNIASIKYEHREYNCCREILEKILSFLSQEPQDSGVSIKVCFLLLEVLLRQWNDCPACHTGEQLINFKNQSLQTLTAAEIYISLLYKLYPSLSEDNYDDNNHKISVPGSVDFKDLIMNVLKFKVNLFYARIYMSSQLYVNAEKYISIAMMIFSDCIEPVMIASDTDIILTDTQGIQVITAALSSYLGLISIELPVDRNIVRQTLGELKRKGLNTQVPVAIRQFFCST